MRVYLSRALFCAVAAYGALTCAPGRAVPINFTSSEFLDSTSIDLSLGQVIYAVNAGGAAVPNETVTVGGNPVVFRSLANSVTLGNVANTFTMMNNAAAPPNLYGTATDQASLDRILDSQAWDDVNSQTVTLQNLTPGQFYRVQVIGPADTRACCASRLHEVSSPDGGSVGIIDRNTDLNFDLTAHVATAIGDFTASGTSQALIFDGFMGAANNGGRAGFSALILTSSSPSAVPHPQITINRTTGAVVLENTNSQAATSFLGYSLTSVQGGFNPALWTKISTAYDDSGNGSVDPNDDWTVLSAPGATTDLSEFNFDVPGDAATISPLQQINLGTAWVKSPFQDVVAQITLANSTVQNVEVVYTGNAIAMGDLNGNGTIDVADWTQFKNGFNANFTGLTRVAAYQKGDMDGDLDQDLADFGAFETAFDAVNGVGAFTAMAASIPEPGSVSLLVLGCIGGVLTARRRQRAPRVAVIVAALAATTSLAPSAQSAGVNFGPSFELVDSSDIDVSFGEVVYAINAAGAGQGRTVNAGGVSVLFAPLTGSTNVTHTFTGGVSGAPAGTYATVTDQASLDQVLNTHAWNDLASSTLTLQNLQVGANYKVQVIGPADTRACCGTRIHSVQSVDGGTPGDISRNQDLDADLTAHVLTTLGSFTADATTQTLEFSGPDPAAVSGFSGLVLTSTSPHGLNISVDRNSGQITLSNQTPSAISLDSYEIRSAGNSLIASAWQSFATRPTPFSGFPQGNGTGNGWEKAPNAGAGALAEWYLNDELAPSSLGPGASVNLGNAYNTTVDAQDLSFSYRLDTGAIVPRRVSYTLTIQPGDYNADGDVDGDDFLVWQRQLGANVMPGSGADGSNNGVVDAADLTVWRGQYGQAVVNENGAAGAVPEPSGVVLALAAASALVLRRKNPST